MQNTSESPLPTFRFWLSIILLIFSLTRCLMPERADKPRPDYRPFIIQGDNYSLAGEYEKAIIEYNRAFETDVLLRAMPNTNTARIYYKRGLTYLEQEKFEEALGDFDRIVRIGEQRKEHLPLPTLGYVGRSKVFIAQKENDRARIELNRATQASPRDPTLHYLLGTHLIDMEMSELSIQAFEKALAADDEIKGLLGPMIDIVDDDSPLKNIVIGLSPEKRDHAERLLGKHRAEIEAQETSPLAPETVTPQIKSFGSFGSHTVGKNSKSRALRFLVVTIIFDMVHLVEKFAHTSSIRTLTNDFHIAQAVNAKNKSILSICGGE